MVTTAQSGPAERRTGPAGTEQRCFAVGNETVAGGFGDYGNGCEDVAAECG